jgi:glycosyltransferase involved in cell wall biosynthesis
MVIAKNEAKRIGDCVDSLAFCDEVLVIDSGSTDGTQEIVKSKGARLIDQPWLGMNGQKDFGRQQAKGEWVLNLDADEVVTPELRQEILQLLETSDPAIGAYRIPFRNYFRDAWVRRCGYYPDPHVRLVRRERAYWDAAIPAHDHVVVDGELGLLAGHIDHYSFDSMDHYLRKSAGYADAFARTALAKGRRSGPLTILVHTGFRFFKAYFLKGGFLEGSLGLTISGLQAIQAFQKYVRLWELQTERNVADQQLSAGAGADQRR